MREPVYIADMEGSRSVLLEGLSVLFHARSGMTHILAPPAPEILEALAEPADLARLLVRMGERFDLEAPNAREAVAARLSELEAAGLVRRA